jgi:hypothetical protein
MFVALGTYRPRREQSGESAVHVLRGSTPADSRAHISFVVERDNSETRQKSETLFSVSVKRVCARCNNEWMNDLDTVVEPWVFDPTDDDNLRDPKQFRRWAIKVALLRAYYDSPNAVHQSDLKAVFDGDDIPEWHVFIGRTEHPDHRHTYCGWGPVSTDPEIGGRAIGITEVAWTLGYSLVVTIRVEGGDQSWLPGSHFKLFKQYNRTQWVQVLEVLPNAKAMPSVRNAPALPRHEVQRLVWFYTPNSVSPIAESVHALEYGWREAATDAGHTLHEIT